MKTQRNKRKNVTAKQLLVSNNKVLSLLTKRLERLARERGFQSYREYNMHYLSHKGLASESEHQKELAKKIGLTSPTEYINHLAAIRAQNPRYAELAKLINTRLAELCMRKITLSRLTGIPRNIISQYAKGCNYPKPKRLVLILEALQIYHHSPLKGDSHVLGKNVVLQKPKHPKYSELSDLIKNALAQSGKNQAWLSKRTGISDRYISMYTNGRVYPSPKRLDQIKKAINSISKK